MRSMATKYRKEEVTLSSSLRQLKKMGQLSFYTMPQYESWKQNLTGNASGWSIACYKGLGTSTSKEGREYFANLGKHRKDVIWEDELDGEAIELAFSKKKIEERKSWLRQFETGTHLDQTGKLIKYSDFVNKELILFSMADLQRSTPSMVDGLKRGQRKIIFRSLKRNFVKEAKVAQFSGYASDHSAYHHDEEPTLRIWSLIKPFGCCNCSTSQQGHWFCNLGERLGSFNSCIRGQASWA